jgi:hydrogenase maturation protease
MIPFPASAEPDYVVVLGLGNVLLGDEGAGVHAMRQLARDCREWTHVEFLDGGTMGITLAGLVSDVPALVVMDAAEMRAAPGTVGVFEGTAMDAFLGSDRKRSVHEVGLLDVLAMAALGGRLPAKRALVGIQPRAVDWSMAPSEPVARAIPQACREAREIIARWSA